VSCCPVVELRQYTLQPDQRDVLIELFDREFVESQEAVGMQVVGQFRDADRPDRFVWLRGFADMEVRRTALRAFYGGPVWKANSTAANATMIDSDDVLLLRPLSPAHAFGRQPPRPARGAVASSSELVVTVCSLEHPADVVEVEEALLPALTATGAPSIATFIEEPSENTFPALPVRTGEHVVVWIQRLQSTDRGREMGAWSDLASRLLPDLCAAPVQIRLEPTPRSRLR
jgi:hypothetical protein